MSSSQIVRNIEGKSTIINNASISSLVGIYGMPIYAATKHAVAGLTKSAAIEWFKKGVRVNSVNPGWVWTAIQDKLWSSTEEANATVASQPQGRWGQPEEIAKVVAFLASDDASLISGHGLLADGGFTIAWVSPASNPADHASINRGEWTRGRLGSYGMSH